MSSVFKDEKYESLDWLSQATQPIESPMNLVLAMLPERIELDYEKIIHYIGDNYRLSLSVDSIMRSMMYEQKEYKDLDYESRHSIIKCFEIEMSDNFILDIENKRIDGTLAVVKTVFTFQDEELQKGMGSKGVQELRYMRVGSHSRINEILELLGDCDKATKGRSVRDKVKTLRMRLNKIFQNNEWMIRDTALADKICMWIKDYVEHGTLSGLTNFCKVKVMTHSGAPIYSIVEEV